MARENKISTLTLAVLGLIAREPCSAYAVRKIFSTTPMGHFSASPGAIYPALKRIEASGWIRGRTTNKNTLRPKRIYNITKKGMTVLTGHLCLAITNADVIWHMDDLLLRFTFMDRFLDREQVLTFLRQFESETKAYLLHLEKFLESIIEHLSVGERMSMEHGIRSYRMNLNWARQTMKEVLREQRKNSLPGP